MPLCAVVDWISPLPPPYVAVMPLYSGCVANVTSVPLVIVESLSNVIVAIVFSAYFVTEIVKSPLAVALSFVPSL